MQLDVWKFQAKLGFIAKKRQIFQIHRKNSYKCRLYDYLPGWHYSLAMIVE